ncbi:hypothetical protein B0J14DRAFT_326859 [Halenospora varia]|nr:hypothetical protein B0J14DRAFT_326859 [Halenospora varia]
MAFEKIVKLYKKIHPEKKESMETRSTSRPTTYASESPKSFSHGAFYLFSRLPCELQLKIWSHYLEDATRQMYRFTLRYPIRLQHHIYEIEKIQPVDQLFLQPYNYANDNSAQAQAQSERACLQPIEISISTRRIASMTCVQSRKVVLEMFPDTLTFRIFPKDWGLIGNGNWRKWDSPDGSPFPEYVLRFNGAQDIIVFNASWTAQAYAVQISRLRGSPHDCFRSIQHVGLDTDELGVCSGQRKLGLPLYGTWYCEGGCGGRSGCTTNECRDRCIKEPLPHFLSLFPQLKNLYIVKTPRSIPHDGSQQREAGNQSYLNTNCPCPPEGSGHDWPVIRDSNTRRWFVIYDERGVCPFPKFPMVEEARKNWRGHFPYYRAFEHLNIEFIQPLRPKF